MKFYDREKELAALKKYEKLSSSHAQFIVITGRRRIGKTTLIKRAFTEIPFLYFFVGKKSEALLCEELCRVVRETLNEDIGDFTTFKRLFAVIMGLSKRINFTLVLDEFQNFKYANESIFSDIQDVWDDNKAESKINLVACGSIYSKMKKIFEDKDEPLFGRATARFRIKAFSISTLKMILNDFNMAYSSDDLLSLYSLTGGVAKYVELLMEQNALDKDAMIEDVVSMGSYFIDEGREMLADEFGKDYGNYFSVIAALASGYTTRGEITSYVGFDAGGYLDRLENDYGIIAKRRPYMMGEQGKNVRFEIADNFLVFWFRFIYKYWSAVEIGNMDYIQGKIHADYETFSGFMLERYYRQKYAESGVFSIVSNYWESGRGGKPGEDKEIDLIAMDGENRSIVIGEVKRNHDRISIPKLEEKSVRILAHQKQWDSRFIGLSLEDM